MILIECPATGERCLVDSLDGYAGWRLVAEAAAEPPHPHCRWCEEAGDWIEDAEAKARAERIALVRDPEALLDRIDALEAEIAALKS